MEPIATAIEPVNADAAAAAQIRQNSLTKPPGALGTLEDTSIRLAAIAGQCPPPIPHHPLVTVFAGDHGVCAQQVSPWPSEVTVQMMANMLAGGAAINVLARQIGAPVWIIDIGVAGLPIEPDSLADGVRFLNRRIRSGTRDLSVEPALTTGEVSEAISAGIKVANAAIGDGADVLLTGDMGIGNTTPSAAIVAALTGADPREITGAGAAAPDSMVQHKAEIIAGALAKHHPTDPHEVLAAVGGLEHCGLVGLILGAANRKVPVLLDGVIAQSAALAAVRICPDAAGYLLAGHRSAEPASRVALDALGLSPLVDLGMRLGEGSGAAAAFPLVQMAARILAEMATFDSAGVSNKEA